MKLIVEAEMPQARLGKSPDGRTVLVGGKLTAAAVASELEEFP
jgi:hypothetical protein